MERSRTSWKERKMKKMKVFNERRENERNILSQLFISLTRLEKNERVKIRRRILILIYIRDKY